MHIQGWWLNKPHIIKYCLLNHALFNKPCMHYLLNHALFNKPHNSVNFWQMAPHRLLLWLQAMLIFHGNHWLISYLPSELCWWPRPGPQNHIENGTRVPKILWYHSCFEPARYHKFWGPQGPRIPTFIWIWGLPREFGDPAGPQLYDACFLSPVITQLWIIH